MLQVKWETRQENNKKLDFLESHSKIEGGRMKRHFNERGKCSQDHCGPPRTGLKWANVGVCMYQESGKHSATQGTAHDR